MNIKGNATPNISMKRMGTLTRKAILSVNMVSIPDTHLPSMDHICSIPY